MEPITEPKDSAESETNDVKEAFRNLSSTDILAPRSKRMRSLGSRRSTLSDNVAALVAADLELVPYVIKLAEVCCYLFSSVLLSC
jgi:hypothetical protein